MRSAHNPGPTNDQEALQEEFLGALQALAGSAVNGRRMELLSWEEAPYEAVKACLLASGRVPAGRGRGGSLSLADGAGDEGAGGSASEPARSSAEPGGSVAAAEGSLAAAAVGKTSALSAPPRPLFARRSALISAAVTGQIDVRGLVSHLGPQRLDRHAEQPVHHQLRWFAQAIAWRGGHRNPHQRGLDH
jgi:hypothetical protein